jgi:hypothetical protein
MSILKSNIQRRKKTIYNACLNNEPYSIVTREECNKNNGDIDDTNTNEINDVTMVWIYDEENIQSNFIQVDDSRTVTLINNHEPVFEFDISEKDYNILLQKWCDKDERVDTILEGKFFHKC